MLDCVCSPVEREGFTYVQWIGTYFRDCVYLPRERVAFGFGMAGMFFYLLSMTPQIYKTYKSKSVEGISLSLFVIWILGDISNLLGSLFTDQVTTIKYTGMYFVFMDAICILQYVWYKFIHRRPSSHEDRVSIDQNVDVDEAGEVDPLLPANKLSRGTPPVARHPSLSTLALISVALAIIPSASALIQSASTSTSERPLCILSPNLPQATVILGNVMAWASGLFYFSSRIPQIVENHKSKKVEGLSVMLFVLTVLANLSYGVSILLRFPEPEKFLASTLPYLIGSIGTLLFDFIIIGQSLAFNKRIHS